MSRVKIVATIGPETRNEAVLRSLVEAGMDLARLNGSHADLAWHTKAIELIRAVKSDLPILLDIPGSKIRVGQLKQEPDFQQGDTITLTTESDSVGGTRIPVNHQGLHRMVQAGDVILADDGTLRFTVMAISGCEIVCRAETAGRLRSGKGINIPAAVSLGRGLTGRDSEMLCFARQHQVDFVGISFVDSAEQIQAVRDVIGKPTPRVLAKIETGRAMGNLEEIIANCDAVMIDRGDLSAETNVENLAIFQKRIINVACAAGKPVIVATELLHSMIQSATPTKAEVTDISNAVLDGAAALMLSGETAIGRFPVESVRVMRLIADTVAQSHQLSLDEENGGKGKTVPQAMGEAIALVCRRLPVTKIVAITVSGYAARMLAARRPKQPILAVSNDEQTARSMNLLFGTEGLFVKVPFSRTSTDHIAECLKELWHRGKLHDEDLVLVTSVAYPKSGNRMNTVQLHKIGDLRESQGWEIRAQSVSGV